MSQSVYVDLSPVLRSLEVVQDNVVHVGQQVAAVAQQNDQTRSRLEKLYQEFLDFVAADTLRTELQLSETRLVKVRQELEQRFGHYAEVRRRATGILQATDVSIVRQETMRTATEELMMAAPRYWLAPGLVALTAWIADNRPLAERALAEALQRDPYKTSLFFALVCRRATRLQALLQWLDRYFQMQDPRALDREVVVMLDAVANGVFGGAAQEVCRRVSATWIAELEQQGGFLEEQRQRWTQALDSRRPRLGADEYAVLRQYSPTWPALEASLAAARRNGVVAAYFRQLFDGEVPVPVRLQSAVDDLLDSLVTHFDDEELPLRKDERLLHLVVDCHGDRQEAERRMKSEAESFEEKLPFAALLTNAAMHPEQSGATLATQRYAVGLSREWILMAHRDMVARDRVSVPLEAELKIGNWSGKSRDAANEPELVRSLEDHYTGRIAMALADIKMGGLAWFAVIVGSLLGLLFLAAGSFVGVLVCLILGAGLFFLDKKNQDGRRDALRSQLTGERDSALRVLRAALAELADYRRDWARADAASEAVVVVLESVNPDEHIQRRAEDARAILH